jgi:circadian clock protein KaiB
MTPTQQSEAESLPVNSQTILFRLYIAGSAPNSVRAVANLNDICKEYLSNRYKIEIIDVLADPLRALTEGILLTPTLVKVSPLPGWQMAGDLSAKAHVLLALGMKEHISRELKG